MESNTLRWHLNRLLIFNLWPKQSKIWLMSPVPNWLAGFWGNKVMFLKSQAAIIGLSAKSYLLNFPLEFTRKLKNIKEEYFSCFCPYNDRQSASTYIFAKLQKCICHCTFHLKWKLVACKTLKTFFPFSHTNYDYSGRLLMNKDLF